MNEEVCDDDVRQSLSIDQAFQVSLPTCPPATPVTSQAKTSAWGIQSTVKVQRDPRSPERQIEGSGFLEFEAKVLEDPPGNYCISD